MKNATKILGIINLKRLPELQIMFNNINKVV